VSTSDGTDERRKGILAGAEAAGGRPRLRKKKEGEQGEVPIPAYGAMQREPQLGSWMLETAVPLAQNRDNYLPKELRDRGKVVMRAVFRLPAKEGMAKLREAGQWLEREHPSTASLRGAHSILRLVKIREVNQQQAQKVEACPAPERYRQLWAGDTWL